MRGSPLLNALVAFVAIALLGIPVQRLTRAAGISLPNPVPNEVSTEQTVPLEMHFTSPPRSIRIQHLAKVIWSADQPGSRAAAELTLAWPKEGIDLLFEIAWPEGAPLAAARITLTDPEGNERTASIWGSGPTNKVLTFP